MPRDPVLYPNVVARALETALDRPVAVNTLAHPGSTVRSAWHAVTKDPHIQFEMLMGADAVIVGVGSFDHAPLGVPAFVEALVPFIRPAWVRRRVRNTLRTVHPWVIKATRARWTKTPAGEFGRLFDAVLFHVRGLTQGAAAVVLGPSDHRALYYGNVHPHREARERLTLEIAARHGFPAVASWPLVEPFADHLNPDGMHWPPEAHAAVGDALAGVLLAQLRGELPRPDPPSIGEA